MPHMAPRENTPKTEVLAISPGLSHLINAAKGTLVEEQAIRTGVRMVCLVLNR